MDRFPVLKHSYGSSIKIVSEFEPGVKGKLATARAITACMHALQLLAVHRVEFEGAEPSAKR